VITWFNWGWWHTTLGAQILLRDKVAKLVKQKTGFLFFLILFAGGCNAKFFYCHNVMGLCCACCWKNDDRKLSCRVELKVDHVDVPQNTVIGPNSFLSFVNDLPEVVQSSIYHISVCRWTKMYRGIDNINHDRLLTVIQSDINRSVTYRPPCSICFSIKINIKLWQLDAQNLHRYIIWHFMRRYSGQKHPWKRFGMHSDWGSLSNRYECVG